MRFDLVYTQTGNFQAAVSDNRASDIHALNLFQMKKEHRPLVQNLLPLLETLAEQHSSVEVRDMASDLHIAIATHGAVWSHKMEAAAMNFGKQTDAVRINSESTAVKGMCHSWSEIDSTS